MARPVNNRVLKGADHTYVVADYNWGKERFAYHGTTEGGSALLGSYGNGDGIVTYCIGKIGYPCKVNYGINGVCHQEANRFLYPSGKTVSKANGYWLFYSLYGGYGESSVAGLAAWSLCKSLCN